MSKQVYRPQSKSEVWGVHRFIPCQPRNEGATNIEEQALDYIYSTRISVQLRRDKNVEGSFIEGNTRTCCAAIGGEFKTTSRTRHALRRHSNQRIHHQKTTSTPRYHPKFLSKPREVWLGTIFQLGKGDRMRCKVIHTNECMSTGKPYASLVSSFFFTGPRWNIYGEPSALRCWNLHSLPSGHCLLFSEDRWNEL